MIKNIIEREAQAWASELKHYDLFLKRSLLTQEEKSKLLLFEFSITAILRELEELGGLFKVEMEREKIKNRVIRIWPRQFKENGVISYGYFTYEDFIVKGEENLGPQIRSIKIYFNKNNIDSSRFKNGGFILVAKDKMKKPWVYEIKDGKYPYIWIDEVIDFIENEKEYLDEKTTT